MTRRRKIALAFLLALVVLWFCAWAVARRQTSALQASFGTTEEPLTFIARTIKPGWTRAEVRHYVRGYAWLETLPPDGVTPGGADVFNYQFGLFVGARWGGVYGSVVVTYDAAGRVRHAHADIN